jgi:hypothetical protein
LDDNSLIIATHSSLEPNLSPNKGIKAGAFP